MKQRTIRKRDDEDDDAEIAKPIIKKETSKPKSASSIGLSFDDDVGGDATGFKIKKSKLSQANILLPTDLHDSVKEESLGGMYSKESLEALKKSQQFTSANISENDPDIITEMNTQINSNIAVDLSLMGTETPDQHPMQNYDIVLSGEDAEKLEEVEEMERRDKGITDDDDEGNGFIPFHTPKQSQYTDPDREEEDDSEMKREMTQAKLRAKADAARKESKANRTFMSTSEGAKKAKSKGVRFVDEESALEVDEQWESQVAQRAGLTVTQRPSVQPLDIEAESDSYLHTLSRKTHNSNTLLSSVNETGINATAFASTQKKSNSFLQATSDSASSKGLEFQEIKSTLLQAIESFSESTSTLTQKRSRLEQERELLNKQKVVLQRKVEIGEPVFRFLQVSFYHFKKHSFILCILNTYQFIYLNYACFYLIGSQGVDARSSRDVA